MTDPKFGEGVSGTNGIFSNLQDWDIFKRGCGLIFCKETPSKMVSSSFQKVEEMFHYITNGNKQVSQGVTEPC